MSLFHHVWTEEDGVLSFEWTLLLTLLTLGIVGGLAAARDAIIDELGDVAEAAQSFDQSYTLAAVVIPGIFTTNESEYTETDADRAFADCERATSPFGQMGELDGES